MNEDTRCCGTGTCIIDKDGKCWCGQQWDGEKMCFEPLPINDLGAKDDKPNDLTGTLGQSKKT